MNESNIFLNRRLHKSGYHEVSRYIVPSTDPSSPLRTQSKTFDYDQDHSTRRLYDEEDSHLRRRVPRKMAQDDLENQVRVSSAEIAQARESIKPSDISMRYILNGKQQLPENSSKSFFVNPEATVDESWEYPGWGSIYEKVMDKEELPAPIHKHQLNVVQSTSISGNDLLASVLYTTGIVCSACGQLASIVMLLCCIALYPYRKIFKECGLAIPLNGGVYVAMLNSASKIVATFAASCSLIAYSATAVVSAASCTSYASQELGAFPVIPVTIGIMGLFAALVFCGVKDSANVAMVIFCTHVMTLLILLIASYIKIFETNGEILIRNWNEPLPVSSSGGIGMDLYLGFSVALLGLTGFETSANYIEEAGPFVSLSKQHLESSKHTKTLSKEEKKQHDAQPCKREPSIFEKTIDNMWFLVIAINPAIALGTLGVVELPEILANQSNILSVVGYRAGGDWLRIFIAVDAVLVLAGGVLTAFVGVTGLIRQLASDRCLPSFLLQTNTYFHTYHWIIIFFFLLCCMLYLITNGDVTVLSGVFSVSFLMVLILFATANIFLKYYRPNLPRAISIDWISLLLGWAVMVVGLIGNIIFNVEIVIYFIIYLVFYFSVIIITFQRTQFLKLALFFLEQSPSLEISFTKPIRDALIACKNHTVVFFAKTSDIHVLNKAILYTRDNELCDRVIIIHVVTPNSELLSPPSSPTTKTMMSHHKTDGTDDGDEVNPFSDGYNRLIVSEDNEIELTLKQKKTAETKLDDVSEAFDLSEIDLEQKEQPQDEQDEHVYHHGLTSDMMSTWNTMQNFKENLALLDHVYPKMKLDLLLIHYQEFSPELVLKLSEDLNIKPSFMFIRCPNERFPYHLGQFEGVRTIMK